MDARFRFDKTGDLIYIKREGDILEGLLHLSATEDAEIAALLGGGAVALDAGKGLEGDVAGDDALAMAGEELKRLLLAAGDLVGFPGRGATGARVLHEKVAAAH